MENISASQSNVNFAFGSVLKFSMNCVHRTLCDMSCPDFTLVVISGLEWNHDMVLWDIPPVSKNDAPYTKGADEYLQLMIEQIIPNTEKYKFPILFYFV